MVADTQKALAVRQGNSTICIGILAQNLITLFGGWIKNITEEFLRAFPPLSFRTQSIRDFLKGKSYWIAPFTLIHTMTWALLSLSIH